MNPIPFLSKHQFKAANCKADALFPIMDYSTCKYIWENSPLIEALCKEIDTPKQNPAKDEHT